MEKDLKRFYCENGHVIGLVRRDGHSEKRLCYLRNSIDESRDPRAELEIAAIIDSGDVTCSICGSSRVWIPSAPALDRLLKSHRKLLDGQRRAESEIVNAAFLGA